MARVYTSRQLIDPNLASYMEQVIQNRVANEANRNKEFLSSTRNMLSSVGSAADDYIGRFQREKELQNAEANKNSVSYIDDPTYRAAREEYIRTGSSQPITSYMLQKEAAAARKADAEKNTEERNRSQKWHDSLEESAARKEFSELTEQALTAQKSGNLVRANNLAKQANRLRDNWSARGVDIGDDVQGILDAATKEEYEQWKKDEEARQDKEEADKLEQERLYRVEQFLSTLPTVFKNDVEKQSVYDLIKNNKDMNTTEKAAMLKKVRETVSGKAAVQQARQNAQTQKAGEATGKAIDENTAQLALAKKAKEKKEKGFNLTSAEQEAYDAVYGGK